MKQEDVKVKILNWRNWSSLFGKYKSELGLTESEAVNKYGKVTIYTSRYTPLKNHVGQVETPIADRGKDYMKICVDTATDRVVGLHMVGDGAGEIMQGFATAIKCGCKCIFTYIFYT